MKKFDIAFSIFCGLIVAEILREFGYYFYGALFLFLPILTVVCLYFAEHLSKSFLFIFQLAKHILAGVFATIVDLKFFEFLFWISGFGILSKIISFIVSAFIKYLFNKFWTFQKNETNISKLEFIKFLVTNLVGLIIDVSCFAFLTKFLGPQFLISEHLWIKLSVLISAVLAGAWNFCGDKFFVFKK
jgi:putative flippase GtrA